MPSCTLAVESNREQHILLCHRRSRHIVVAIHHYHCIVKLVCCMRKRRLVEQLWEVRGRSFNEDPAECVC